MGRPKKIKEEEVKTEKALSTAMSSALSVLQKKYGESVIIKKDKDLGVESIPTGCYSLDAVFDCGGLPRGRIIEVFGQESSGKSTLAMFIMSQIQKSGGRAALIDAEYAFDSSYATDIGVNVEDLLVSQPGSLEEAMDIIHELVKTNEIDIIVVDSVASMVPKSEIESDEMLKEGMAVQARLMNKALRILTGPISKSKTTVIFINQVRDNIGVQWGPKERTPGGKALKFYSSVRLQVKKGERIFDEKNKENQVGNWLNITAVKNKVGFPWKQTDIELYYARGVDLVGDTVDFGEKVGVLHKTGNTWMFGEKKLGVGREQARATLDKDEELYKAVRKAIDEYVKNK